MKIHLPAAIVLILILLSGNAGMVMADDDDSEWPEVYRRGPEEGKYVALTFDDAPMPECGELLEILDELDVRATFFIEGEFASWRSGLLVEIAEAGHEIGNHTYNHPNLTEVDDEILFEELESTNEIIRTTTGIIPHLFRPPGGNHDSRVDEAVCSQEMVTVMWTVNTADYRVSASEIRRRVLNGIYPGGIILLHDGVGATREVLPDIVNTLRERGYTFITVGEMLEMTHGECPWPSIENEWQDFPEYYPYL